MARGLLRSSLKLYASIRNIIDDLKATEALWVSVSLNTAEFIKFGMVIMLK